jgi:hypothetical protein
MSDWTDDLKPGVEELVAAQSPGPHLEPDEIAAYRAGELPSDEEERVREHLVLCRDCAELLLDLEALGDPDFGAGEPWSAADAATVWEGVEAGMKQAERATVVPFRRGAPMARPPRWLHALAACLLLAVVGLSAWVVTLRGELSRMQPNAPVLDLYPEGSLRRGAASVEGVAGTEVPADAQLFTLHLLNPAPQAAHESYEVEILGAGDDPVWRDRSFRPNSTGSFTLALSRRALGTGDYRIRLYGLGAAGTRELIGEYSFALPAE